MSCSLCKGSSSARCFYLKGFFFISFFFYENLACCVSDYQDLHGRGGSGLRFTCNGKYICVCVVLASTKGFPGSEMAACV